MFLLLTWVAVAAAAGQTPASPEGPRWQCAQTTYDFGEVWAGTPVVHPFEFKNAGTKPLHVLDAKPHCSCSVSENYTRETAPGQVGVIPFRLGTDLKSGRVNEFITVKTDDPVQPSLTVYLTGIVKTVCEVEAISDSSDAAKDAKPGLMGRIKKAGADFGIIDAQGKLQRVLRMKNTSGSPLSLALLNPSPPDTRFRADLKETRKGEEYELTVTGDPPFPVGGAYATFYFRTGIAGCPTYQVLASAYLPARIEIVPQKIVVSPKFPTIPNRRITLANNGSTPVDITAVACTDPAVQVSLLPRDPATPNNQVVSVVLPAEGWRPPDYGEIVRIETNDKEKPRIDVYILPDLHKEATPRPADKPLVFHPGKMPSSPK